MHQWIPIVLSGLKITLFAGQQLVVLGQTISISPLYHQRARIRFPMILRSHLVHVGNSSAAAEVIVTDAEFGDVLIRSRRSFALMSTSTGRSARFPDQTRYDWQWRFMLTGFESLASCLIGICTDTNVIYQSVLEKKDL